MEHSFKDISDYILDNNFKLKFKLLEKEDVGNNIEEFFNSFFVYNKQHPTIYYDSGETQTTKNKRRTITDIYLITKYYFPRLRISTVYKHLVRLILEKKIVSSLCEVLHSRVYRASNNDYGFNGFSSDEFKIDFNEIENGNKLKDISNSRVWGYTYQETSIIYKEI